MGANDKAIREFLDAIADEKLKNFVSSQKTIVEDRKAGFRLDHQGINSDGSRKDRLHIQPIGGKSKASKLPTKTVLAQIHVIDPGDPKEIRDALSKRAKEHHNLIILV